ncbi:hypothetical protein [Clostridium sp. SM-530-WT-3G]|uniref:hypothetical protein n=1 Tax=Clostridium sp. SM-530-WT-3G TaxID=2725303 RepID=UPI00145F85F7|nr:hypothetical protein [Clostridium sp. SM-530-WT-3G]NME82694.1 hypothetical protein [Clostridium sp. SM-530-WT-3G]
MNDYSSDLLKSYKEAEKRVQIYDEVIKDHKALLKKYDKNSKEYKEIKEMIDFVKGLDDYKKVNKNALYCLIGMVNFSR